MRRVLLIALIGIAVLSVLCVGLALGVMVTPAQAQIGRALERVLDRAGVEGLIRPEVSRQNRAAQPEGEAGILVAGVAPDSPAEQAGLRRGDILLEVDGQPVNTLEDLRNALQDHQEGNSLSLLVQRGDEQQTLTATLSENQDRSPLLGIQSCGVDVWHRGEGVPIAPSDGARITEVVEGSPAEQAGLEVGEVILAVDGQEINADNDLAEIITSRQPGDSIRLRVQQVDGQELEVTVELGENPDQDGTAWLGIRYGRPMRFHMDPLPGLPLPEGQDGATPFPGIPFPPGNLRSGALIRAVTDGSPADQAGLEVGQVVTAIDGKELLGQQAALDALSAHQPGDRVTLTVYDSQSGETKDVAVTLGENPNKAGAAWLGLQFHFLNIHFEVEDQPEG